MDGNKFYQEVLAYKPFDADEENHKKRILEHLKTAKLPFSREELAGHITGSVMVVNEARDKTFMILHKKLQIWLQPGGHCDGNPNPSETAYREVIEETGFTKFHMEPTIFDIDVHPYPEKTTSEGVFEPEHFHYDVRYLVVINENEAVSLQVEEVDDGRWFTLDEAFKLNPYRAFSRMIDKIRA